MGANVDPVVAPVRKGDVGMPRQINEEDHGDLDRHDRRIEICTLFNADDQNSGDDQLHQKLEGRLKPISDPKIVGRIE